MRWDFVSGVRTMLAVALLVVAAPTFAQSNRDDATTDQIPNMQPMTAVRDAVDEASRIAESSGFPIPPGALDGAKSSDLMYQTLKMIFGKPLANITTFTNNRDPEGDGADVENVNVIVYLFSMMAGIGLLATLVSSIWTILQSLVSINTSAKLFNNNGGQGSPFAFLVSRIGAASVLNVPLPFAGGMALSQVIMLLMALLGIGLGSQLFYYVAARMINQPLITYTSNQDSVFFLNAAQAQLCLDFAELNEFIKPEQNVVIVEPRTELPGDMSVHTSRVRFGDKSQCGEFRYEYRSTARTEAGDDSWLPSWAQIATGSGDMVERYIEDTFRPRIYDAVGNLLNDRSYKTAIRAIMNEKFSADGYTPSPTVVQGLATAYGSYKEAIREIFNDLDEASNDCQRSATTGASQSTFACSSHEIRQSIADSGFMLAGTYSYVLNERQSLISNAIESYGPVFEFKPEDFINRFGINSTPAFLLEFANKQSMLQSSFNMIATENVYTLGEDLNRLYEATTSDGAIMELMSDILYDSIRAIVKVGYAGQSSSFQNPEPITQLAQIGNVMMALPFAIAGLAKVGSAFKNANLVLKMKAVTDAIGEKFKPKKDGIMDKVLTMMLAALLQAIVVGGFFLAVFVPAIPYLMWNIAIFGYIGYVILVVIGVPIMIAAKPLNDGDGFIGGVKTGYMMAFTVFIRPAAMVIGLVVAMTLSRVFSWIINATYFESMQIAHSNGFSVAAFAGVPLMYCVIQLTAIYKAYSMINEVPAFIGKMTETDRAHSDFGEESERNRVGGLFIQSGNTAMSGLNAARRA